MSVKKYNNIVLEKTDNKIVISYDKEENKQALKSAIILFSIIGVVILCVSLTFLFLDNIGLGICAGVLFILTIIYLLIILPRDYKKVDTFYMELSEKGVMYSEIKKIYFISWQDINSFGIIHNTRTGTRWRVLQGCIFFTKVVVKKETETKFFKRFEYEGWIKSHKNSNETIALYLGEIEGIDRFYMDVRTYICMHCGKEKEFKYSFPKEEDEV